MTPSPAPVVLLVVPNGTHRPEPLATAIHERHPDWRLRAVWAGDPHLRPVLDADAVPELSWCDDDAALRARELELAVSNDDAARWLVAVRAARCALADGAPWTIVLAVGEVAVTGALHALVPASEQAVFVPRCVGPVPDDGCRPDEDEMLATGVWSTNVAVFTPAAVPMLAWLSDRLAALPVDGAVGRVFDRAVTAFDVRSCDDPDIGVGAWRWDTDRPALLDLPHFDPAEPWVLDPTHGDRQRVSIADHPERRSVVEAALAQVAGQRDPLAAPGGLVVDDVIRSLVAEALRRGVAVPPPWTDPAGFRAWLEPRYWTGMHAQRCDLRAAFPDPLGVDRDDFTDWCRRSVVDHGELLTLAVSSSAAGGNDLGRSSPVRWPVSDPQSNSGFNLVGYLSRELSLGDVARRLHECARAAGVSVSALDHHRSESAVVTSLAPPDDVVRFQHTLAVVNADQFPALELDHPELFAARTHLVGYWFWELEHVPVHMRRVARMVDEIWVGSRFVADAFASAVDTPVRHVPIPAAEPVASDRTRASFPVLAAAGDRFVFAVVFDHFSVTERKNPVGVIEAFRRAFAPGEGPVLVVKSMNADRRWPQHQHVVSAAAGRPDIVLWDEHLSRVDHMAFIRSVDALVSLHRSEGLGLHLAEAMWLGTPVIATRYSGNLDLMDDDCSLLIDASITHVVRGEGVYPPEATWADPDLDQAAAAMRRVAGDPDLVARLARAGRDRMARQPSLAETGRLVADLLGIPSTGAATPTGAAVPTGARGKLT